MKKVLCMIALCMMCITTTTASQDQATPALIAQTNESSPSIIGTWVCNGKDMIEDKEVRQMFQKIDFTFTFTAKELTMVFVMDGNIQQNAISMDMGMKVTAKGTYQKSGNKLSTSFTKTKPSIDLYKFKLNVKPEMKEALESMGMGEEAMRKMINDEMKNNDFSDSFKDAEGELTIEELTANKLVIIGEDGKKMVFHRK